MRRQLSEKQMTNAIQVLSLQVIHDITISVKIAERQCIQNALQVTKMAQAGCPVGSTYCA